MRNRAAPLTALGVDNFGSGLFLPLALVYVTRVAGLPLGIAGAVVSAGTALSGTAGTAVLHVTRRLRRVTALQFGSLLYVLWCAASLAAFAVAPGWRPAVLLVAQPLLAAAGLVTGPRQVALAEAVAPPQARGRYLAAFQYSYTAARVLAPAVVALYSVAVWLPWVVTAGCAALAIAGYRGLAGRLPAAATTASLAGS